MSTYLQPWIRKQRRRLIRNTLIGAGMIVAGIMYGIYAP